MQTWSRTFPLHVSIDSISIFFYYVPVVSTDLSTVISPLVVLQQSVSLDFSTWYSQYLSL